MKKKNVLKSAVCECPIRICLLLLSIIVIIIHIFTRNIHEFNRVLSVRIIRPVHAALAVMNDMFSFSLAEVLIAVGAGTLIIWLAVNIYKLVTKNGRLDRIVKIILSVLTVFTVLYAGFCMLWGVFYYGDDFADSSGFLCSEITVSQLKTVTRYFAEMAGEYGELIPRDADGKCASVREDILDRSATLYSSVVKKYPFLDGPAVHVKGIYCSRIMSMTDFTGFFFPFTAEANVNMDFPQALFASTVAHELAHQRGVAKEQEANFVAVLASLESKDTEYIYSAALLAYIHLGNALNSVDRAAWLEIYESLSDGVKADLAAENQYWKEYRTPIKTVSNTVYEGFLKSYDQTLGMKSYGACVDLLVNYYYEDAIKQ